MPTYFHHWQYTENHPVLELLLYGSEERYRNDYGMHIFLATEGYTELLRFCLSNVQGWSAAMEINVIRIASFFGHAAIVEMLLSPDDAFTLHSDEKDRQNAAILGVGEALRYRDLESLVKMYGAPTESIMVKGRDIVKRFEGGSYEESNYMKEYECFRQMMSESLIVAVLNGYMKEFFDSDVDNKTSLKTLKLLVDNRIYA